jgi:DNA-binding transcriptional LysR family regulator
LPIWRNSSAYACSTRKIRLTDVGSAVLEDAQHTAELGEAVDSIASNHLSHVSGTLRLSAPPSISDSLLAPLVGAFQASYPDVRVQIFITERRCRADATEIPPNCHNVD